MPDALSPPLPIARGAWDCSPWVDGSASARLSIQNFVRIGLVWSLRPALIPRSREG